jgi:hypothetical protein
MTGPQPTTSAEVEALADLIDREYELAEAAGGIPAPFALARVILASDWLAAYVQAARDEERARVLGEVHLMLDRKATEWADEYAASNSDADYGRWDGWENAARFVRDARGGAR